MLGGYLDPETGEWVAERQSDRSDRRRHRSSRSSSPVQEKRSHQVGILF